MSTQYPPLPYRRLKMMANGIWDEAKKAFYPFRVSSQTVPAKTGIRYFVHSASITGQNYGDTAAVYGRWMLTIMGTQTSFAHIYLTTTTVANGTGNSNSVSMVVDCLCDAKTALERITEGVSAAAGSIVYAEIPDDLGWVVIE